MFIEYKMEDNTEEIVNINKIQFCVFGNDEVKRYSVVNKDPYGINIPETYDSHEPKRGGLLDSRMGTTDYQLNCATCGLNSYDCPGHFGHTELAEPVFHYGFIDHVKNILSCVCIRCSKLLIYKNEKEINDILKNRVGKARFDEIKRLTGSITYCQNPDYSCGAPIPNIRVIESEIQIIAETKVDEGEEGTVVSNTGKQKIQEILRAEDCYNILKNISDVDCRIMGFDPKINRPENLVILSFPIPPVAIRPSIKRDTIASKTYEDSMTDKLVDVIKSNTRLRVNKEKSAIMNEEFKYNDSHHKVLQYHVATYFNNETSMLQKSEQKTGGRLYKSVSERLKGKQGRIRGNLLGKRTNFSGRTVITSNPDIGTDELGVPLKLAMVLTFPEVVTPQNISRLSKLVKNGRDNYPGANYVFPKGNNKRPIDLRYRKKNIKIHYGDIIERHLVDGDYVLYNRQPSLHKLSMMGHRCVIFKDPELTTFGMNVSVTAPYNADYDGDEMNIFVPQSIQASTELELIANVRNQIIAPGESNPKIELKQDAPLGAYLLTRQNMIMEPHHASNIIMKIKNIEHNFENEEVTSYDVLSALLPKKLNIVQYADNGEKKFEIINGKLLKGTLTNQLINKVILTTILDQYGNDAATDFIDNFQRIILQFLLSNGSTIGLKDIILSKEGVKKCKDQLKKKRIEVESMLTEIENNPDLVNPDVLETNITSTLQSVLGDISKIAMSDLKKENNLFILIDSKAKGKPDNVANMSGGRGQVVLNFARIKKKVNKRTLPHYFQNDDRPEARGYIESSLFEGLKPLEFFMDAMTGREGLIDTAIKSVTGDTKLMILDKNKTKQISIGEWIDELLEKNKSSIEYDDDRELLQLPKGTYIPTSDLDGNVSWGEVTAITRHDPSENLYEIETHGGRKVIVTDSHSLLIWNEKLKKFERIAPTKISIGSYVPVTANLCQPSIISNHIDITQFLPKNDYIHGTDFIKAKNMLEKAMSKTDRAPNGWWNTHNGTSFTLPYATVQLFLRTLWRSNNDMVVEGCIYPYASPKNDAIITDKFELTYENGLFLGLYIAEGNSDIPSGYVQVTNNDPKILKFVEDWFTKLKIKTSKECKINHIGGTSTCIRGYSVLLGRILYNLVGHGARNKFIHGDILNANLEFMKGLINGIISGDGTITKNSIQLGLSSPQLINDINICLSRFGIFGKVTITRMKSNNLGTVDMADINMLSIRSQWATKFKKEINLINDNKQDSLNKMIATVEHRNFTEHNDVVLDEIIKINKIVSKDHPEYKKVYDLTVPSTLNFGLANGLHVVDTAESGYIQRRLIKCMEDLAVHYDGTVRNGNNVIIQYLYGDSQLDQVKQKMTQLKTLKMNNEKIKEKYYFTKDEIEQLVKKFKLNKTDVENLNDDLYEELLEFRNLLRTSYRRTHMEYKTLDDSFFMPVSFNRIIDNARYGIESKLEDLDPIYIMDSIEYILHQNNTKLLCMTNADRTDDLSLKVAMEKKHKSMFRYGLLEYLSPKRCIHEYKLDKNKFNIIMKEIINSFNKSLVEAGEMVGCVGSQSLGERTTQMTLNTKHASGAGVQGMQGIPRLNEIIRNTKNVKTPLMYIYLNKEKSEDKDLAYLIGAYLKYTVLKDVVKKVDIVFDNDLKDNYMTDDQVVKKSSMNLYGNFNIKPENLPWLYRFEISKEKLFEKKLNMLEIKTKFINFWDELSNNKNKSYRDLVKRIINGCIMTTNDNAEKLYIHIRFDISEFDNSILLDIQNMILYEFQLKGVTYINDVPEIDKKLLINFNEETGDLENKQEYIITTDGVNMNKLRYVRNVDINRTYCNEINTIYKLYGIKAARKALLKEINMVFSGDNKLNYHHISILCDVMTNTGEIVSIDRHGFGRMDTDPLSKASFERTVEMLVNSAVFGEVDKVQSVSSRLIMGRAIKCGTGFPEILMDNDILENTEYNDMEITSKIKNSIDTLKLNENSLIDDILGRTLKSDEVESFMI
jgi:DNA-directed RNA polymerase beta' subunit